MDINRRWGDIRGTNAAPVVLADIGEEYDDFNLFHCYCIAISKSNCDTVSEMYTYLDTLSNMKIRILLRDRSEREFFRSTGFNGNVYVDVISFYIYSRYMSSSLPPQCSRISFTIETLHLLCIEGGCATGVALSVIINEKLRTGDDVSEITEMIEMVWDEDIEIEGFHFEDAFIAHGYEEHFRLYFSTHDIKEDDGWSCAKFLDKGLAISHERLSEIVGHLTRIRGIDDVIHNYTNYNYHIDSTVMGVLLSTLGDKDLKLSNWFLNEWIKKMDNNQV